MIRIEVSGIDAVEKHLQDVPVKVEREVLRQMAQFVYDHAEKGADRHTKTGALRQSLYNRPIPGGREIGHDTGRAPYAVFVHWGTRPHVIGPKNKKVLRWSGPNGFTFSRHVNHPGYKGDPYLTNAARDAMRQFDTFVQNALRKV